MNIVSGYTFDNTSVVNGPIPPPEPPATEVITNTTCKSLINSENTSLDIKDLIFSLRGSIGIHGCEYYISLFHKGISINSNGKLFALEDIDKYKFQKRVLGYTYEVGDFPICETEEDAMKLLNELLKSILK